MSDLIITSPANARLKSLVALRRRRAREEAGTTLIEGYDELSLALDAGVVPRTVYFCPELMLHPDVQREVVTRVRALGSETQQLGRAAFEKVAYREGPDGFLAVVDAVTRTCADLTVGQAPLVLLCQGVEKPGNLGAMLRTADAAGAAAVIAADPVTDWGNPNLVRASKGTVFSVPVATDSTEATLQWLRDHDITLVATNPGHRPGLHRRRLHRPGRGGRRRREVRPDRRGARRRPAQGPDPDGRPRELPQRRHVRGHRHLRGGPAARSPLTRRTWGRNALRAKSAPRPRGPRGRGTMCAMRVDHVSYAAESDGLKATAERLAKQIGVDPVDGGVHPRFGTRNIIFPLRNQRYVEVVEVLDHPASYKAPFGQAVRARSEVGGGWLGWAVAVDDLSEAEQRLGREAVVGSRHRPDGVSCPGASSASRA